LILVAGPSAAGKTTLIRQLRRGRLPELAARLDMDDFHLWHYTTGENGPPPPDARRIFLDYNASQCYREGTPYQEDPRLHVVKQAQQVWFVTVWTPPDRLGRQYLADHLRRAHPTGYKLGKRLGYALPRRMRRRVTAGLLDSTIRSRHRARLLGSYREPFTRQFDNLYADPRKVVTLYRNWLAFCRLHQARTAESLVVEFYDQLEIQTPREWESAAQTSFSQESP
jgi:GTPase SAR1 family protein